LQISFPVLRICVYARANLERQIMPNQKLYAGVKIRETRQRLSLTQKEFAAKMGGSLSYLNQMENNHRPISAGVILSMAREFGFDVTELSVGETTRIVADMREALADPVFGF